MGSSSSRTGSTPCPIGCAGVLGPEEGVGFGDLRYLGAASEGDHGAGLVLDAGDAAEVQVAGAAVLLVVADEDGAVGGGVFADYYGETGP